MYAKKRLQVKYLFLFLIVEKPSAPGKPEVTKVDGTNMDLKWTKPLSDGGCSLDGYTLEYQLEGGTDTDGNLVYFDYLQHLRSESVRAHGDLAHIDNQCARI